MNELKQVICIFFDVDYYGSFETQINETKLIALYEKDEDAIAFLESINEEWVKQYVLKHTDDRNNDPEVEKILQVKRRLTGRGRTYFECEIPDCVEICITINVEKRLLNQDFRL